MIIFDDEEEDIGNLMTMKLEYSSDEEVKQLTKKMKTNDQPSIKNYFSKK